MKPQENKAAAATEEETQGEVLLAEVEPIPLPPARVERRAGKRIRLELPARICPEDPRTSEEVRSVVNSSRKGIYFTTWQETYYAGMAVRVTFPFISSNRQITTESIGRIVRVELLPDGRFGVAIQLILL